MAKNKHWIEGLLVRVLPIWRGQIGFACELTETTIIALTVKFSGIVAELNKVKESSLALIETSKTDSGLTDDSMAIDSRIANIRELIGKNANKAIVEELDALRDEVKVKLARYEKSMEEINVANDLIKSQVEEVLVDFQFQDRVSQILRQVAQAQNELCDVVADNVKSSSEVSRDFDADEWLEQLQESYAMEDQVRIHAGKVQNEAKKLDEITFF